MIVGEMRISLVASIILLLAASASFCAAGQLQDDKPPKSACRENSHGSFWPVAANDDSQLLQAKAAEGELWVCRGNYDADFYFPTVVHTFKWERVSVRYAGAASEPSPTRRDLVAHRTTVPPSSDAHP